MPRRLIPVFVASDQSEVYVERGTKPNSLDFIVVYRRPHGRPRRPKHIHIVVDLYLKRASRPELVDRFVAEILEFIKRVSPATALPPVDAAVFQLEVEQAASKFLDLNGVGDYPVDFLIAVIRLLMIQEKTNYPRGTMNTTLFERFRAHADIFTVVGAAAFRGRGR